MTFIDFALFVATAAGAEFLIYVYMSSEGKFRVSKIEQAQMSGRAQKITQMSRNELINITREVRDGLADECKYKPVKQMLQYTWGLSEEISDQIADQYGTRFSEESKTKIDKNLAIFMENYSKGEKLGIYDSIANQFHEFLGKKGDEELDNVALARELRSASESLAKNNPRPLLDVLSRHVQRSFREVDVLLFMNAVNDIIYRTRSQLFEGPTYHDFLRRISKYIVNSAKAIERRDSLRLYESYEQIFQEALTRVEKVAKFQSID